MTKAEYQNRLEQRRQVLHEMLQGVETEIAFFSEDEAADDGVVPAVACTWCGTLIPGARESKICAFCWAKKMNRVEGG